MRQNECICSRTGHDRSYAKALLFCNPPEERIVAANGPAMAIRDGFPVFPGHTLIILQRHVITFFDTTTEERLAMFELMEKVKLALDAELHPAAYNIGVNDGPAAGQTISHLHFHLLPRYAGDDTDPRGGVSRVLPKKANYW